MALVKEELVGFVVVPEENENDYFVLFVDDEFENKTTHNVNSSFSSEIISEGFVMIRVENDLIDFFVKNFFENRISLSCFVNSFLTDWHEIRDISHFSDSRNFAEALYPIGVSFNAFFNSSICSGFIGNSSTGCQSICSQNSQSSSVTSLVCLNRSEMSCLINLTTAPTNNLESNCKFSPRDDSGEPSLGELINSISNISDEDYLKFSDWTKVAELEGGMEIAVPYYEKKKKGSNRMVEPNRLIRDYNKCNKKEYLNISMDSEKSTRVAEWLLQSFDTRCPLGFVGSIPTSGVFIVFQNTDDNLPFGSNSQQNDLLYNNQINPLQSEASTEWTKVSELKIGMEIAVVDSNGGLAWEMIKEIKQHAQHVYDLAIEGTHNFIANDIVAHNTYLGNSSVFVNATSASGTNVQIVG